jgi:hypothetical protein
MTRILAVSGLALLLASAASAQETTRTAAPNVTGTWNMGLQGGHVVPVALTLEQNGTEVTGVILLPTPRNGDRVEIQLKGELAGVALTLSGAVDGGAEPASIEIAGTVNDDGSMEGTLKGPHGKVSWTAERLRERK